MANTTWNPSDKTAGITLTGSNLIATAGSIQNGVRAIDRQLAGKFYWEVTITTFSGSSYIGASVASVSLTAANPAGSIFLQPTGTINVNGASSGVTLGARSNGDIIGFAVDLTARQIWLRVAPSGNWNGNAGYAPNTGVGGIDISSVAGVAIPLYPAVFLNANGQTVTANFGDTAFTGSVPSGFTSGFTAGASISTNALATQIAVEHWLAAAADAQVTQVAVEHWASVAAAAPSTQNVQAMVLA